MLLGILLALCLQPALGLQQVPAALWDLQVRLALNCPGVLVYR